MSVDDTNDEYLSAEQLIARAERAGCLLTQKDMIEIRNGFPPDVAAITPSTYMLVYGEPGFTGREVVPTVENTVAKMGVTACVNEFNANAPIGYTPPVPQQKYNLNLPKLEPNMNKNAGDC